MKDFLTSLLFCSFTVFSAQAETVTFRIVEYNADADDFVLATSGQRPLGSYAVFENDFGATRGNRYNQIPRNKQATLWLEGWEGFTINSVTLSLCSNNSSGTVGLSVMAGDRELYNLRPLPFDDPQWFGHWLSKDLQTYAEITKEMNILEPVGEEGEVAITVKGGTPEGSVYLDAVTVDYDPSPAVATESPLGWVFEKVEAKGELADGDVIMLYRSGDAAGDIDGVESNHYLDAIGVSSTSNVVEPFIELFTLGATTDGHWTLTDQYGQLLGAKGVQSLTWVDGSASSANAVTTWDITLGYSGATIVSTNSKYGTLRYNAPSGSYPRFWNYTSTSLPLPYIYRRVRQLQPVQCQGLEIFHPQIKGTQSITVNLTEQDTLLLHTAFSPTNVTSRRLLWESSDPEVATVQSGVVFLHAPGKVTISASCLDWKPDDAEDGSMACIAPTAYLEILVVQPTVGVTSSSAVSSSSSVYDIKGRRLHHPRDGQMFIIDGRKRQK